MLDFKPVTPADPIVERDYVPIKEHLELKNIHRQLYEKYQLKITGLQPRNPNTQATN
ncbi:hypothetical protein QBC46DRAFT_341025 [Diplogelasinospora grovesii]|uniref:Uncharacterized protein n=1 Tax=Diplogelasinospora grovesii TaxID=303347 RepID=A0AAN6S4M0_9PEZI|nr:hypothetical protein QBC46DRAFT_341025 [Diplogelasinospora grovesii]